jgi:histone-lysine N-methyltransferase SETD1
MSKPQSAGFKDFFPLATREAKNKAKERQKAKTKALDSPNSQPTDSDQDANNAVKARDTNAHSGAATDGGSGVVPESAILESSISDGVVLTTEDNESLQGDLLNGVGSASSHTSTISSVFSAPPATSTFGWSNNPSNLTPLTTADSSPPGQQPSPRYPNTNASAMTLRDQVTDITSSAQAVADTSSVDNDQNFASTRLVLRDPNKGVKGEKCTYDPQLDHKLSSSDKKKAKPIYKAFGLVCTHSAGSVILLVRKLLANGF